MGPIIHWWDLLYCCCMWDPWIWSEYFLDLAFIISISKISSCRLICLYKVEFMGIFVYVKMHLNWIYWKWKSWSNGLHPKIINDTIQRVGINEDADLNFSKILITRGCFVFFLLFPYDSLSGKENFNNHFCIFFSNFYFKSFKR